MIKKKTPVVPCEGGIFGCKEMPCLTTGWGWRGVRGVGRVRWEREGRIWVGKWVGWLIGVVWWVKEEESCMGVHSKRREGWDGRLCWGWSWVVRGRKDGGVG